MDPNNQERTARAGRAIYELTGIYRDSESCTVDFLADLMHLWGRDGVTNALRNALRHHAAESGEPDAVPVFIPAADAEILPDALGLAAEYGQRDARDNEDDEEIYESFLADVAAFDRLSDAIAAAAHQTTEE